MANNIGINVIEVNGSAPANIAGAAVSVGAFLALTQRGVTNRPTRIHSFPEFQQQFGGYFSGGLGAYLVKGFFDNGGQTAYINRIVGSDPVNGAAPAALTLQDGAPANTLTLRAGYRGAPDPGAWGGGLYARVTPSVSATGHVLETARAVVQGTALAGPVDMSAFPSLSVAVDGESAATVITFQASDFAAANAATPAEIRDAVNRRTSKLIASLSATNQLTLTSSGQIATLRKAVSSLQVTAANATLGFAAPMAAPVRGTLAAVSGTGTRLGNVQGFQVGDAVRVTDGANTASAKVLQVVPATGEIAWTPTIAGIGGYDPYAIVVSAVTFDLTLAQGGTEAANVVESWSGLSMERDVPNYALAQLNDPLQGSRVVMAVNENSPSGVGANLPAALAFTPLTGGRDGTPTANDFIGDPGAHTGIYAFDAYDVQLLGTERTDPAIVTAALAYCAGRGDCMFVGAVPQGYTAAGQAATYGQAFQGAKVYGALYAPWIKIFDPLSVGPNPTRLVPPVGHVMGVCARIESTRGIWKAPAGDEANVAGALDVEYRLSDAEHTDLVKSGSVNGIRVVPGAGIVVDASRTLSTDSRWLYVNVRLLFNYVKSSLRSGLRWVRQEPNRDTLWNAVKFNTVTPFLMGLWKQGAFGSGTPAQVFTVICDATNNPPDQVDLGNFKVEVYFYPSKPAETIVIVVGQKASGATAAEV